MLSRLVLLMIAGCAGSAPLSPAELTALARAESKWKARPFADYRYEMQQLCFCPPEVGRWTRVTVRQGKVVGAERVEPDSTFPVTSLAYWGPIDSLFSRLRQFARDQGTNGVYRDIIVEFDPALGYPTRIEWVSRPTVQDAGAIYMLRNVQPLR